MKTKIISALLSVILLAGCGKNTPETPPSVTVDAGGISVSNTTSLSCWNNTVYLLNGAADDWIEKYGEPIFLPLGTVFRVTIPSNSAEPDTIVVKDILINEDGSPKYDEKAAVNELSATLEDNIITFSLDNHWASGLSSDSEDYKEGAVWRCFEITCTWDENVCVYSFCVRTNPTFIFEQDK